MLIIFRFGNTPSSMHQHCSVIQYCTHCILSYVNVLGNTLIMYNAHISTYTSHALHLIHHIKHETLASRILHIPKWKKHIDTRRYTTIHHNLLSISTKICNYDCSDLNLIFLNTTILNIIAPPCCVPTSIQEHTHLKKNRNTTCQTCTCTHTYTPT